MALRPLKERGLCLGVRYGRLRLAINRRIGSVEGRAPVLYSGSRTSQLHQCCARMVVVVRKEKRSLQERISFSFGEMVSGSTHDGFDLFPSLTFYGFLGLSIPRFQAAIPFRTVCRSCVKLVSRQNENCPFKSIDHTCWWNRLEQKKAKMET